MMRAERRPASSMTAYNGRVQVLSASYDAEGKRVFDYFSCGREDSGFEKAAGFIREKTGRQYAVLRIILPDVPVVFASFCSPKKPADNGWYEYLKLRCMPGKKTGKESVPFFARENRGQGVFRAFAFACHKDDIEAPAEALYKAGLAPDSVMPCSAAVYDLFAGEKEPDGCGIFLSEDDFWAFMLVSPDNMPVMHISGIYSESGVRKEIIQNAFAEIERGLRRHFYNDKEADMKKIIIAGNNEDAAAAMEQSALRFDCERSATALPDGIPAQCPFSLAASVLLK